MSLPFNHDASGCASAAIGPSGLSPEILAEGRRDAVAAMAGIAGDIAAGSLPAFAVAERTDDIAGFAPLAERLRGFEHVVLLATGGSSLGGQSLAALAGGALGLVPTRPRLTILDNLDADAVADVLDGLAFERTAFLAISKSGSTLEVFACLFACLDALRQRLGAAAVARHLFVITEPGDNLLRRLATGWGCEIHEHDPGIGGRYSVLSIVGLVIALMVGLDAGAVRHGAAAVLAAARADRTGESPPLTGAALAAGFRRAHGITTNVLMVYAQRLTSFAAWYAQLWAESLGKDGIGFTPIRAVGPVDQHSQLQLFLDGPADKTYTVIALDRTGHGPRIAVPDGAPALGYLAGRTIGDAVTASWRATAETLVSRRRPTRVITLTRLDETALGALFMHFMLETVLTARLIGVDPFGQPAVEEGKVRAKRYLTDLAKGA